MSVYEALSLNVAIYDIIDMLSPSYRRRKGVCYGEYICIIFTLCLGRCSLPLYLQMAGQREISDSQPRV